MSAGRMRVRFSHNLAFNLAGLFIPAAVSIVTVPFYIHAIGSARYGLVSITWILLGYFGFLDFGLSRASVNALSRLKPDAGGERSYVLVTAFCLNALFGSVASLLLFLAGMWLMPSFPMTDDLRLEAVAAFPWVAPMLPLGMVIGVATGALESRERFLLSNVLNGGGLVLNQVLPLACVYLFGPSLAVVIPALVSVRVLVAVVIITAVLRIEWPVASIVPHIGWAKKLFGYGAWVSVSSLINPMLETFDQLFIGRMLGPSAVAHYAVPMSMALRSQMLATALARTIFPRLSREDTETGRRLTAHAIMALLYGFGAICGPAIILAGPFLAVWISPEFARDSRLPAEILLFGAWLNGVAFMPFSQLQAQGKPHITARVHAIEVVPFLLGLWLLIHLAGLPGAALAWSARVTADCVVLTWLAGSLRASLLRAVPGVLLMLACLAVASMVPLSVPAALGAGALAGVIFLALGILFEPTFADTARKLAPKLPLRSRPSTAP